eukprot:gene8609-biopygen8738
MQDVDAQETAAQETTPGEAERCFPFDLKASYYCVGIILDFQKFMQFDVRGELYQCSALPFKWNDSPRIFVNFMKVLAEVLPSPIAIRDHTAQQDYLQGHRPSVQSFSRATHDWVPARKLAAFNGLCQSVYLGVPAARLYLRELYFVLAKKRSSGAKVERVEDLEVSNSGEDAHGAFPLRVGVVLNLKLEARGFWRDELRHLQIMHLELEAVFKTPQVFLHELRIRWCGSTATTRQRWRCWCQFTSRNPELMRRMQRLWSLLDLNDIESLASYIHRKANEVADHLSRDTDLDDWKLNRRWFERAQTNWGEHTVDRFESEVSAQLTRYCGIFTQGGRAGDDGAEEWLQLSEKLTRTERHQEAEEHDDVAPKGIRATLSPPYSSAMNNYHEDMGLPGPAKGDLCGVNGMVRLQMAASETMGATVTERMWLLAKHACTYVVLTILSFGRPDTGTLLQQENAFMEEEGVKMVLTQEKCKNHQRKKRQLSFHWWGVERPWELLKLWTWCRDEA